MECATHDCGKSKPVEAFQRISPWPRAVYGRCKVCRNRRKRERYHSSPEIRAAEIARATRNKAKRRARTLS